MVGGDACWNLVVWRSMTVADHGRATAYSRFMYQQSYALRKRSVDGLEKDG